MFRAFSAFNSRHHRDLMGVDLCVSALSEASSPSTPGVVTNVENVGQHDQLATESTSDDCSEPCQEYPQDDVHWNSFLLLLQFCRIANSPIISPDTIAYVRILIEEKLRVFKELYPYENLSSFIILCK